VVVDATTGRIVPIADQGALDAAVAELVDAPGMRRRYGEAARRRCLERFTIEATAPRWRDLLTAVARAPSGTARPSGPPPPRA
jgi:glycosyltransferase involved in cell wall biosynthesis